MKFSAAHIISVVHDRMLVNSKELHSFLEYLCGIKLHTVNLAAACDYCKIPLFQQFSWVDKLVFGSLDKRLAAIGDEAGFLDRGLDTSPEKYDPNVASKIASRAPDVDGKVREVYSEWLKEVHKRIKGNEFEVKTLAEMGNVRALSNGYFTNWWLKQREKDSF